MDIEEADPAERDREGMRRSSRVLAVSFALIATLLLASLVILVQRSSLARDAALARKQHSFNVILLTSEVEGSLARSEAALGLFVSNGDRRTGTLYFDAWRRAGTLLYELQRLVGDNPEQLGRMTQLQRLYRQRGTELAEPALHARFRQGWLALSLYSRAGGSGTLPKITRLLREVADSERALLDARVSSADDSVYRSNALVAMLSAIGILVALMAIAATWFAMTAFAERRVARDRARAEIDRAEALERAVTERTLELSDANRLLTEEAASRADTEAKLRQVQKMDAIGQLTGGIAHDFNNMLAVVLGGLELARKRVSTRDADAIRHIDNALEGANRASALTRRLLSFARAEPLLPSAVASGSLMRGMGDLIDRTIGERIQVRIDSPGDLWPVWIDPFQLENAILNLCVNARDAMNGAGVLRMEASNLTLRDGEVGSLGRGDYVRIAVSDNGRGMAPEVLERVFEPFFTTKPVGAGTGLGLSQLFGFARQSGGDVVIRSTEGIGTTVSLYLPRHRGEVRGEEAGGRSLPPPPAAGQGTILVVEDDARVRASTGEALTELGYQPLLCASGEEALAILGVRSDIQLLVTDVLMPGMTGPELVRRVRTRFPTLAVLFVTGYAGEADRENFANHAVLRKPFTMAGLAHSVAGALAPAAPLIEDRAA